MAVRNAGTVKAIIRASVPKMPKLTDPTIKGPGVPKLKTPGVAKIPTLPSLSVQARRGLNPKLALAKAASGASVSSSKRNPDYPTL